MTAIHQKQIPAIYECVDDVADPQCIQTDSKLMRFAKTKFKKNNQPPAIRLITPGRRCWASRSKSVLIQTQRGTERDRERKGETETDRDARWWMVDERLKNNHNMGRKEETGQTDRQREGLWE